MLLILATTLFSWPPKYIGTDDSSVPQHNEDNRRMCVKAYNKTYIYIYVTISQSNTKLQYFYWLELKLNFGIKF